MGRDHLTVLLLKFRAPAASLVPRTPTRLLSVLYVGQPQQEKPCLFHHKHGDAQVSGCVPTTLIILPFPKLLPSLVTTAEFLQIHEKLIQIGKMLFFRQTGYLTRLTTQIIQYQCQLKIGHRTTMNLLESSKWKPCLQERCICQKTWLNLWQQSLEQVV